MDPVEIKVSPNKKDECFMVHGIENEWWLICTVDGSCPAEFKGAIANKTHDDFPGCPPPPAKEDEPKEDDAAPKEGVMEEKKVIEI